MSNKKNLLIYAHYYIPDTASTGQILRELAEGMLDKFNITVICVVPSYLGSLALCRGSYRLVSEISGGLVPANVNIGTTFFQS